MNILNFMQRLPDEASCIAYLKEQREQSGVVCKRCGCREHRRDAGKLSFRHWIATMFLPAGTKESSSTEELRRRPGHKRCQPVWEMSDKLRDVMGKRDGRYRLCGQVELTKASLPSSFLWARGTSR